MKKDPNAKMEKQLLELLKKVLPKATHDPQLAGQIYAAVEQELKVKNRSQSFADLCERIELPSLEPDDVEAVKQQLALAFQGGDVTVKPNKKARSVAVEVGLPDGTQFSSEIKVRAQGAEEEEEQPTAPFVALPVCLPGDKELVWFLGRRENLSPDEAGISLSRVEEEFWATKTGLKLQKDRVEKCFAEFIARVPAGMLTESGLKRHYKQPEAVKLLRPLVKKA
jgi:hypothetical protein